MVTSAFLRSPVPDGVHLAIEPPAVLVRAGLCEPDELWIALAAMMKKAVTNLGLKFEQGTALEGPREVCEDVHEWSRQLGRRRKSSMLRRRTPSDFSEWR